MSLQLQPIDLVAPGFRGLNLEKKQGILHPSWATEATNMVIDGSGRLASRGGYSDQTTTAITGTPAIKTLHEYIRESTTNQIIVAWNGGIANSIDNPEGNDISGVVTDTNGTWWFQNYNDKCIGFQNGQKPIVYNGAGSFATVVEGSGTAPTVAGGVGLCAYGRVWAVDSDGQTIKFTGLLDETNWGGVGAGSIDMQNIWTRGTDTVKAIKAFNGALIVFGLRHIVIWVDGVGAQLGIDPDNLYVADVIEGTGCVSQWPIQNLDDADLVYLSRSGLQSLQRVKSSAGSAPVESLTRNVRTEFVNDIENTSDLTEIRSEVDPSGLYVITFPTRGRTWCFHYKRPFRDEEGDIQMPVTTWDLAPTAWLRDTANQRLLLGYAGNVGLYNDATQDNGTSFQISYESPWLDLGEGVANRLKMLKRIGGIIFVEAQTTISIKWDFDFKGNWTSKSKTFSVQGLAEWGIAEWGIDEWGGGLSLRIFKTPATGTGQYIRLGLSSTTSSAIAIQQLELFSKIGKLV